MAVDVGISHMTLLIVTLAFSLVNICLIIATGGIIYNWQDRFMGPVLKCDQPKWTSDGRDTGKIRTGLVYTQTSNNWGNNGNNGNGWGVNANAGSWGGSASVSGNWNNGNNGNTWTTASWSYASGVVGSSNWASWKDNQWSTCPYVEYPRWSSWTQPTQTWNTWTQPAVWNTWTQPTAWVAWTAPIASWSAPVVSWTAWTQPVVVSGWTGGVVVSGK